MSHPILPADHVPDSPRPSRDARCPSLHQAALAVLMAGALNIPVSARTASYPAGPDCAAVARDRVPAVALRERIAHTANGDIAYYRFGSGSPIVLQTGFRASIGEWNADFVHRLAQHHDVIVFDNRGIGRSIPDAARFTVRDMASDLHALIDALALKDVTVVGWSMGGAVTAQFAIEYPHAARRIVLMAAPAPGSPAARIAPAVDATLSGTPGTTFDDVMSVLFPSAALPLAERCFRDAMFVPPDYTLPEISATVTAGQSSLLRNWSTDADAARALHRLSLPTLVLAGDDDTVLPPSNAETLAGTIAGAQLLVVRSAGHAMMFQYPRELAAAIDAFILQSDTRRSDD
ncbi:TPA: alpha/beta hydrolase [Burkholderia cenocepacia]|uniref:alpha/beta fold hydrolase n=1 Tax=unclassified Burkholderia TaxID=2613784 RepID=UPI00158868D9|nr:MULTISPECIES: alpha/beta hydrolase [unclassified Burkholderia]HEF5875073.1 alpha/beta hydrolase [Burkholderia cenocepacia]